MFNSLLYKLVTNNEFAFVVYTHFGTSASYLAELLYGDIFNTTQAYSCR